MARGAPSGTSALVASSEGGGAVDGAAFLTADVGAPRVSLAPPAARNMRESLGPKTQWPHPEIFQHCTGAQFSEVKSEASRILTRVRAVKSRRALVSSSLATLMRCTMPFFYVEPEVAGGLGKNTVIERKTHPPRVSKLHYQLDGWLGDPILESFPCFIVTDALKQKILEAHLSGAAFSDAEVTASDQFRELYPEKGIPNFVWLRPGARPGEDDLAVAADGRLVVSEAALVLLRDFGASNAVIADFP